MFINSNYLTCGKRMQVKRVKLVSAASWPDWTCRCSIGCEEMEATYFLPWRFFRRCYLKSSQSKLFMLFCIASLVLNLNVQSGNESPTPKISTPTRKRTLRYFDSTKFVKEKAIFINRWHQFIISRKSPPRVDNEYSLTLKRRDRLQGKFHDE